MMNTCREFRRSARECAARSGCVRRGPAYLPSKDLRTTNPLSAGREARRPEGLQEAVGSAGRRSFVGPVSTGTRSSSGARDGRSRMAAAFAGMQNPALHHEPGTLARGGGRVPQGGLFHVLVTARAPRRYHADSPRVWGRRRRLLSFSAPPWNEVPISAIRWRRPGTQICIEWRCVLRGMGRSRKWPDVFSRSDSPGWVIDAAGPPATRRMRGGARSRA